MRRALALLAILLPALASADGPTFVYNPTPSALGVTSGYASPGSVDSKGRLFTIPMDPSTGESVTNLAISNATDLNGRGVLPVMPVLVVADAVEAASTTTVINATAHVARVGDIVELTGGTAGNVGAWSSVCSVATNAITLCSALPATPAAADTFDIKRPRPRTFIYPEDLAHASTDPGAFCMGVRSDTNFAFTGTDGDYSPISVDQYGQMRLAAQRAEDVGHNTGEVGIGAYGINNAGQTITLNSTDGDYTPFAVTNKGSMISTPILDAGVGTAISAVRAEDSGHTSADAGIPAWSVRNDSGGSFAGSDLEYSPQAVDITGRAINTLGAAPGATFMACSSTVTDTTTTDIKAAVASNRIYVTSISCTNDTTVSSLITFRDGATGIWGAAIGNTTLQGKGNMFQSFPVPLRGSVNTAFRFTMGTTATSTICCAAGYISPQ